MRRVIPLYLLIALLFGVFTFEIGIQVGSPRLFAPPVEAYSAARPLAIPSLRQFETAANAAAYYAAHRVPICAELSEAHDTRCKALFAMYIVHTTTPYGETDAPRTVDGLLASEFAQCGVYAGAQHEVNAALGLTDRQLSLDGGWHGLIEAEIDGVWEVFDSTTNVWISIGAADMAAGAARRYRALYSPLADAERPDARQHRAQGYDAALLRALQPYWGIGVNAPTRIEVVYGNP